MRTLYDCADLAQDRLGKWCRVVVATHPAKETKSRVGMTRSGVVYELFLTSLPRGAFTAADVVALYLHRGALETTLADEDLEQDPDRWCSHAACSQVAWQFIAQWVWNLRLELGHQLHPDPVRTTEFAPALSPEHKQEALSSSPSQGYGPAEVALPWKQGRFSGQDFPLQPDGTLRCPAGQSLVAHERRTEADGSLRIVYAASIRSCRPCPLRDQCQTNIGVEGQQSVVPCGTQRSAAFTLLLEQLSDKLIGAGLLSREEIDMAIQELEKGSPAVVYGPALVSVWGQRSSG